MHGKMSHGKMVSNMAKSGAGGKMVSSVAKSKADESGKVAKSKAEGKAPTPSAKIAKDYRTSRSVARKGNGRRSPKFGNVGKKAAMKGKMGT